MEIKKKRGAHRTRRQNEQALMSNLAAAAIAADLASSIRDDKDDDNDDEDDDNDGGESDTDNDTDDDDDDENVDVILKACVHFLYCLDDAYNELWKCRRCFFFRYKQVEKDDDDDDDDGDDDDDEDDEIFGYYAILEISVSTSEAFS